MNIEPLRRILIVAALVVSVAAPRLSAQAEPISLSNGQGAAISFTENEGTWRWTQLDAPGGPIGGWPVSELSADVGTLDRSDTLVLDWRLVEVTAEKIIFEQE